MEMPGLTLDTRVTSQLADIVDTCARTDDDALPWEALRQVQALVHADGIIFTGFDTVMPYVWLDQRIHPGEGTMYLSETPTEALGNPFWEDYWDGPCSYADRTGDFASVTTVGDFVSLPEVRAGAVAIDAGCQREMVACMPPSSPGRHLRVVCLRELGSDFTELDRFLLSLVRPHLERAFWSGVRAREASPALSRRQVQIMRMVQSGLTNRQIARRLDSAEGTVRTHLNRIYGRLGVQSRTAAVQKIFGPSEGWP
jgi:DNA-binding CsgD family transcriptional regulator